MTPTGPASSAQPVFGPATAVLELAVSGRWRSPETTAALADHAVAQARAEGDGSCALLAEGWLLHGLAAVGRGPAAVPRAAAALADAMRDGHRSAEARLRVGLAAVARELGDQDSARALLGPLLSGDISDPELAADAYVETVRGGGPGLVAAVDLAVGHIRRLRGEQVELGLAALDAALANRHRADGNPGAAAARARDGLRRLLGDPGAGSELDPISPHIAAWLSLEQTLALLDDGQADLARRVAEPALAWSGRPAALVPLTRLRLTLAQRAYLPLGENEAALRSVAWAAGVVGEQDLPGLEADCQSLLAEVHEQRGALPDALTAIRRAHQALRVHSLRVEQALVLIGRIAGDPRPNPAPAAGVRPGAALPDDPRPDAAPAPTTRPDGPLPVGTGPDAQTIGLPPVGGSPAPASDHGGLSAGEAFTTASPTVRLPIVPRRPADLGAEPRPARGPEPTTAAGTGGSAGHGTAGHGTAGHGTAADRVDNGWSGLTGWPEEIRTESPGAAVDRPGANPAGAIDALGAAARDRFAAVGPEALGWAEAGGWDGLSAPTPATGRPGDAGGVEAGGLGYSSMPAAGPGRRSVDDPDLPTAGFGPLSDRVHPPEDAEPDADGGTRGDPELDELFEPGEDRPLGLVALDVATPTGPLTGDAVRPLLERIAEHVQGQLPPNSRLAVLARDAVLVVLPPVEPEVVARWMRSLAGGLSARWSEYATDAPRSAFRVAVGALEPGRTAVDVVAELCDRLSRQSAAATGSAGGGRHVARARAAVEMNAGATAPESRSGGRRRRPESGADPYPAASVPSEPPAPATHSTPPMKPAGSSGGGNAPSAHANGLSASPRAAVGGSGPGSPLPGPELAADPAGDRTTRGHAGARGGDPLAPGMHDLALGGLGAVPDRTTGPNGRPDDPIGGNGSAPPGSARNGSSTITGIAPGPTGSASRRGGLRSRTAGLDREAVARLARLASHPPTTPGSPPATARAVSVFPGAAAGIRTGTEGTFYAAATERIALAGALATALTSRADPTGVGSGAPATDDRTSGTVPSDTPLSGEVLSATALPGDPLSGDVLSATALSGDPLSGDLALDAGMPDARRMLDIGAPGAPMPDLGMPGSVADGIGAPGMANGVRVNGVRVNGDGHVGDLVPETSAGVGEAAAPHTELSGLAAPAAPAAPAAWVDPDLPPDPASPAAWLAPDVPASSSAPATPDVPANPYVPAIPDVPTGGERPQDLPGETAPTGGQDPPRTVDPARAHVPTAELSFAELLAGALAAYRDG